MVYNRREVLPLMQMEFAQRERWRWVGIALLQPVILVGIYFPYLKLATLFWDWIIRALMLAVLVWTRFMLLPSFRNRSFRRGAVIVLPLSAVALTVGTWRNSGNEVIAGLRILDALINGYIAAILLETVAAAWIWTMSIKGIKTEDKPFKIAERMRFLRRSVDVLKRVAFVLTLLIMLGIYTLSRSYIFDLLLYARLGAGFIGLSFVCSLIVLHERIRRIQEKEVQWVEREIETALDSLLAWRPPGEERFDPSVLTFWQNYHRLLMTSQRIPITWEVWASVLLLQGLMLTEPYLLGLWAL